MARIQRIVHIEDPPEPAKKPLADSYVANTAGDSARIETAVERLRAVPELRSAIWQSLDIHGRAAVLNRIGALLAEIYQIPLPPLVLQNLGPPSALGEYGDGYEVDARTGEVVGSNYAIHLNEHEGDRENLLGEDPRLAVETYVHEFRHAYQAEQILRFQKPQFRHLVDNIEAAEAWNQPYISPDENFAQYWNQPVERDAREFAESLVVNLFGPIPR